MLVVASRPLDTQTQACHCRGAESGACLPGRERDRDNGCGTRDGEVRGTMGRVEPAVFLAASAVRSDAGGAIFLRPDERK